MNEIFETLSDVFEELRSEAKDRQYTICTEDVINAEKELKNKSKAYEMYLQGLDVKDREFIEDYMEIVDHAHFKEQQRAYYQGLVDGIQILEGLGIIKENLKVQELLEKISK